MVTSRPRVTRHPVTQRWAGNDGGGTTEPGFSREGELSAEGRPTIPTGPAPEFRGEDGFWSPEDLLVAAVSQCTMLWFLHLCQRNGISVESYVDEAIGTLTVEGSQGSVTDIELDVRVSLASGDPDQARLLFEKANELCYVARSLDAEVHHRLTIDDAAAPR